MPKAKLITRVNRAAFYVYTMLFILNFLRLYVKTASLFIKEFPMAKLIPRVNRATFYVYTMNDESSMMFFVSINWRITSRTKMRPPVMSIRCGLRSVKIWLINSFWFQINYNSFGVIPMWLNANWCNLLIRRETEGNRLLAGRGRMAEHQASPKRGVKFPSG